ncbi:MAG: DUF1570 domain-containing protein [Gemmataceae bacterium]
MTHEASRQLLFAAGLVPRNVNVPEWLQFGFGSFFEQPLQSPWGAPGAANPYWLPRFKQQYNNDTKKNVYGTKNSEKTIKGGDRRAVSQQAAPGESKECALAGKARAASALTFFLARQVLDGLPALQGAELHAARPGTGRQGAARLLRPQAFDCVTSDGSVDQGKLSTLAGSPTGFINDQALRPRPSTRRSACSTTR